MLKEILPPILFLFSSLVTDLALACSSDMECKGNRVCEASQCVSPVSIGQPVSANSPNDVEHDASFNMNVLGLLQFGLTPTWEWGGRTSGLLRFRLTNTGALSYIIAAGGRRNPLRWDWGSHGL